MNKPKITVVIPTYNRAELLLRAVMSVLSQTFQDFELIIVDDGSTDDTDRIVKKMKREDSRILYIKQENQGASVARNSGIKEARGKYIAFIDSDDEWLPNKLEKQIEIFNESSVPNLGFVGSNKMVYQLDENKNVISKKDLYKHRFPRNQNEFSLEDFLSFRTPVSPTNVLILRKALFDVGLFDSKCPPHEDYDLWIRLKKEYGFESTWEILAKYYNWSGGISKTTDSLKKGEVKEYILDKHQDTYSKHLKEKSIILRKIGTDYMLADEKYKAIISFLRSIKCKPLYFRSYINLTVAFMGAGVYRFVFNKYKGS